MGSLPAATDDSRAVLGRIKAALDPTGVLAPGRYDRG
jgi:FAD/FMN-containing dehydrogenase